MARAKAPSQPRVRHSLIALVLIGLASAMILQPWEEGQLQGQMTQSQAEIAVEHLEPITLTLALSAGKKPALLDLAHEDGETIKVSVPFAWRLREVRGATLDAIAPEEPSAGFVRYTVPASATISFFLPETPSTLTLRNIAPAPHMSVAWKKVDLATGRVEENVTLVSGEGGKIW